MKTKITAIVKAILKNYGKSRICQSQETALTVAMDEPSLGDSEMDEMIEEIAAAVPEGVAVEEAEGGLIRVSWG